MLAAAPTPQLLPRLQVVAGLNAGYVLAEIHAAIGLAALVAGAIYLAWALLRTEDLVHSPERLHPRDEFGAV